MVPIKLMRETSKAPTRATDGSAGYDFYADIAEPFVVGPHEDVLVPLGVAMKLPHRRALFLWPRSGMDRKARLGKHAGLIDEDYRGEVHALLYNRGDEDYQINPGDRVVQGVIQEYEVHTFEVVDDLDDSARGAGGFGSTGK